MMVSYELNIMSKQEPVIAFYAPDRGVSVSGSDSFRRSKPHMSPSKKERAKVIGKKTDVFPVAGRKNVGLGVSDIR